MTTNTATRPKNQTEIKVPASIDTAVKNLLGLEALVTASEWKRSAIVFAFTRIGKPGPKAEGEEDRSNRLPITEFANLGIAGLASKPSVIKYRAAWQRAIDAGIATEVQPGGLISLPDALWSEYAKPDNGEGEKAGKPKGGKGKSSPEGKADQDPDQEQGTEGTAQQSSDRKGPMFDLNDKRLKQAMGQLEGIAPHGPHAVTMQRVLEPAINMIVSQDPAKDMLAMAKALADLAAELNGVDAEGIKGAAA